MTAPAPSSTAAAPAAAPNPSVEIAGLVAAYARAIESRDVAQLRRAYAGITSAQQNGFESFFESVRSLHVTFNVEALDINGATADARLTGAYDYVKTDGRSMHRPVDFRASFRRDASGTWQMTSVR
ncbi:MAG TPA: hypothetical protein VKA84_14440 [Gemmatimonadaceae bacterium]|nr:hypothetical protein [Gemmatimonadaceae bacterium]